MIPEHFRVSVHCPDPLREQLDVRGQEPLQQRHVQGGGRRAGLEEEGNQALSGFRCGVRKVDGSKERQRSLLSLELWV